MESRSHRSKHLGVLQTSPLIEQDDLFNNFVTNVPVRTYLDPARGGPGFSTVNCAGAATDYSVNLTVFGARDSGWNQLVNVPNSNYSVATIPDGSSNTMFVGTKAITPQQVANRQGNNWDEGIITGGAGGTGRSGLSLARNQYGLRWPSNPDLIG